MSAESKGVNPMAFLTLGLCCVGAGTAMSNALMRRPVGAIGLELIACGLCFVAIGLTREQAAEVTRPPAASHASSA